jgi:FkbM family methyltransferase
MKLREINENPDWTYWVPDSVADWDAPSHWERQRLASMQEHLKPGDLLVDVGTEHAWLTAVYGGFCGYENLVLVEPSPEFWPNIRLTWEHNSFPSPLACFQTFCGATDAGTYDEDPSAWPSCSDGPEVDGMASRYINQHTDIATVTVDAIQRGLGRSVDAITVDVEGAEMLVIQGCEAVLGERCPFVWLSIHPDLMLRDFDTHPKELHQHMHDRGYVGSRLEIDHEEHWLFRPEEKM